MAMRVPAAKQATSMNALPVEASVPITKACGASAAKLASVNRYGAPVVLIVIVPGDET